MEEKLDFSLLDKKPKHSFGSQVIIILLLIIAALETTNYLTKAENDQ